MRYSLQYFLLAFFILILAENKLYQVVSLARHGARYHLHYYGNSSQTKPLEGQLDAVGMRQHQKLGLILRKEYIEGLNFLSSTFNTSEIEVFSTPVNRTIQSIHSALAGLYPPGTGPKITFVDHQLHIPPYSNNTDITEQNFALPTGHQPMRVKVNQKIAISNCPNYDIYLTRNMQIRKDQIDEMNMFYKPFMEKLGIMYNFSTTNATLQTFGSLYDVANVDTNLGRPWPSGFTEEDFGNLRHLANWYYYMAMDGNNTPMAVSGKIQKMLSVFDTRSRIPDVYGLKWTFLSGHDTDIIAMHLAFNLSSSECTEELYRKGQTSALNCEQGANDFASNLIFQFHSDDDGAMFYVKVRSNGKYVKLCGKNSEKCDYFTFKNLAKKYVIANIEQVCGKKLSESETISSLPQNPALEILIQ